MIEIKMENGKSNVCRNDNSPSFLGLTRDDVTVPPIVSAGVKIVLTEYVNPRVVRGKVA